MGSSQEKGGEDQRSGWARDQHATTGTISA
jgi:hypothetical protein